MRSAHKNYCVCFSWFFGFFLHSSQQLGMEATAFLPLQYYIHLPNIAAAQTSFASCICAAHHWALRTKDSSLIRHKNSSLPSLLSLHQKEGCNFHLSQREHILKFINSPQSSSLIRTNERSLRILKCMIRRIKQNNEKKTNMCLQKSNSLQEKNSQTGKKTFRFTHPALFITISSKKKKKKIN